MVAAQETEIGDYREERARSLRRNYRTWVRMPPIEFAEKILRMPGEHGSTRKFSLDFFPPQREMFLELFNPRNREVVYKIASRLTKTMTVLAAIGYFIKESPRKIGVMWPKIGDGEEWSKKQFMGELVDPTPEIAALIQDGRGRRLANNTILSKIFPGGYLSIFGANVPGDLRRFKGNFLYADEIDAIAITETDEGDQLSQFAVRGSEYPDCIQIYSSFPSLKGQSNIDAKYERSDKRVWRVPCLSCGFDEWVMRRSDIRYDKDKTEDARIECQNCHDLHDDEARYKMSRIPDKWHATSEFRGSAGFHANALLWPHPVDRAKYPGGFLQMLALEEISAERADNPERARRVIVNTRDAESYQPEHLQKIEHSALYKRREKYDPREELPAEVVFITFGADLQANRAEIKFKGWGFKNLGSGVQPPIRVSDDDGGGVATPIAAAHPVKQSWAIDYRVVRGSPLQDEFWDKLENVFRNVAWKHPSGAWIRPSIGLMDSSFRPDEVYKFGRRMHKHRIYACEGAEQLGKAIVQRKPIKRGVPPAFVWEIGTHEAKDIIYQQLEITDPAAQGFNHYPEIAVFTEGHFKRLIIEDSVMQRARDGNFYRWFFKKSSDDRTEPLDCEVYANAAEQIYRPNYEKLAIQFATLEPPKPPPDANPDRNLPIARPRMNRTGSKWMSGFGKI
jgi:phage terminase large subunit GpA-like protein